MAGRFEMTNERWVRIEHLLPGKSGEPGATARDNRLFQEKGFILKRLPWGALTMWTTEWSGSLSRRVLFRWTRLG